MAEVFNPVIEVRTGDSEQTVKGLKKEISDLRDSILNLEKGTEAYEDAVSKLQADQRKLNEVMALTKKEATALEGSYDALVHQMSELKKEWRATNDEAKRNELGKQIDAINTQLKELDASIGNHQRNVGNYTESIIDAFESLSQEIAHYEDSLYKMERGTAEYAETFDKLAEAKRRQREFDMEVDAASMDMATAFDTATQAGAALASGFGAIQGAMALCGQDTEKLTEQMYKLQAVMAIVQGAQGFAQFGRSIKSLGTAITAVTGLSAGLVAIIAALAAGVIYVTAKFDDFKQALKGISEEDKASVEMAKLNTELTKMSSQTSAEKIVRLKELAEGYKQLGENLESKQQYVKEYAGELEQMGIQMTNVNDADSIFINQTDDYVNALIARAKADAIKEKATEDYKKALEKQAELEANLADQIAKRNAGTPDKTIWENLGEMLVASSVQEGAPVDVVMDLNEDWTQEIADRNVAEAQAALDTAKANAEQALTDAFKLANQYETEASAYLTSKTEKKIETKTKTLEDLLAEAKAFIDQTTEEDLAKLDDFTIEPEEKKNEGYVYKEGDAEKRADWKIALAERVANREKELNEMSALSEEEKAVKEYEINLELAEKKLELLKQYEKEAWKNGDVKGAMAIQQEIADAEIAIEREKYEELKRLRDKEKADDEQRVKDKKENTEKILAVTQAGLQATSQILNKVAEGYESDGEVTEEEAKKLKAIRYSTTVIDMLQGMLTAFSGAMSLGPIAGPIVGGINAAAVAAVGAMSLAEIRKQDFSTMNNAPIATTSVNPSASAYSSAPFDAVRNITGAQETEQLNQATKVVLVESEMVDALRKVEIRESEASF